MIFSFFTVANHDQSSAVARCFASITKHYPDAKVYWIVADRPNSPSRGVAQSNYETVYPDCFDIDDLDSYAFKYNEVEYAAFLKPYAFEYLLRNGNTDAVVFLDAEAVVLGRLAPMEAAFLAEKLLVLSPKCHDVGHAPHDDDFMREGTFDRRFYALSSRHASSPALLQWWQSRVAENCWEPTVPMGIAAENLSRSYHANEVTSQGTVFLEANFLDFAPSYFDDVEIIRAPEFNVHKWSLTNCQVSGDKPDNLRINGKLAMILQLGALQTAPRDGQQYGYAHFKDGSFISTMIRHAYGAATSNGETMADPFRSPALLLKKIQRHLEHALVHAMHGANLFTARAENTLAVLQKLRNEGVIEFISKALNSTDSVAIATTPPTYQSLTPLLSGLWGKLSDQDKQFFPMHTETGYARFLLWLLNTRCTMIEQIALLEYLAESGASGVPRIHALLSALDRNADTLSDSIKRYRHTLPPVLLNLLGSPVADSRAKGRFSDWNIPDMIGLALPVQRNRMMAKLLKVHPHLTQSFPTTLLGQARFMMWFLREGLDQFKIPRPPLVASLFEPASFLLPTDGSKISNYMYLLWLSRPDLTSTFNVYDQVGRDQFIWWLFSNGQDEERNGEQYVNYSLYNEDEQFGSVSHPWSNLWELAWTQSKGNPTFAGLKGRQEFMVALMYSPLRASWPKRLVSMSGWLLETAIGAWKHRDVAINWASVTVWKVRPDLRATFNIHELNGRRAYTCWLLTHGLIEYPFLDQLLPWKQLAKPQSINSGVCSSIGLNVLCAELIGPHIELDEQATARALRSLLQDPVRARLVFRLAAASLEAANGFSDTPDYAKPLAGVGKDSNTPATATSIAQFYLDPAWSQWPAFVRQAEFANAWDAPKFRLLDAILAINPQLRSQFGRSQASHAKWIYWVVTEGWESLGLPLHSLPWAQLNAWETPPELGLPQLTMFQRIAGEVGAVVGKTGLNDRIGRLDFIRQLHTQLRHLPAAAFLRSDEEGAQPPASDAPPRTGVQLIGYARSETGMGQHIRSCLNALASQSLQVDVTDVSDTTGHSLLDTSIDLSGMGKNTYDTRLFCINADRMLSTMASLGSESMEDGYNIAYWLWELDLFPTSFHHALELVDELWAPSRFIYDALKRVTNKPVTYMPIAVSVPPRPELSRADFGIPNEKFCFIFSFDCKSSVARKNPFACLEAFQLAFPDRDTDVCLIIKSHDGNINNPEWCRLLDLVNDDPRVIIINKIMRRDVFMRMVELSDCYISLHRAEGFGYGPAEAMMLGLPTVVSNYSGSTDFATEQTACVVDCDMVAVKPKEYFFHERGMQWAEPDVMHAASHLRRLFADTPFRARIAAAGQNYIKSQFSEQAAGIRYANRLHALGITAKSEKLSTTAAKKIIES